MRHAYALAVALLVGVAVLAFAGCGGSSSNNDPGPGPGPAQDHTNIVLLDRFGVPLTVDSEEPYSPRLTCGECHDVDEIANGYHFQQGRTDANGDIQIQPDFKGDGTFWILSDGMLGKW